MFKVEIRTTCKVCGEDLSKRYRTYCCKKCRMHAINKRHKDQQVRWQREQRDKKAEKASKNKIQCLICGKWYRQVCSHIVQVHKITGREYRKMFGLDVKRGLIPKDLRELYAEQVINNGTIDNLKAGIKFRFYKGDPRAGQYERSEQTLIRLREGFNKIIKK